ncbi:MAG: hypothetical protein WAU88_15610 [Candidatus Zixiibacteriota bacterium]
MRKSLVIALTVFAMAFVAGMSVPTSAQAATCSHTCSCSGTPLYCCTTNGVTTCRLDKGRYCPQVYTCGATS